MRYCCGLRDIAIRIDLAGSVRQAACLSIDVTGIYRMAAAAVMFDLLQLLSGCLMGDYCNEWKSKQASRVGFGNRRIAGG